MTVTWTAPAAGQITTEIELAAGEPVYTVDLVANNGSNGPIYYVLQDGELPQYYEIVNTETNTGQLRITPLVRELDEYIPEYAKPEGFSYDTDDTAGGNYATYGSALSGGYTFTFTIRAYNGTGPEDSNFGGDFADREFSIYIFNNWSSDRDSFIKDYYEGTTVLYNDVEYEPEDFLIAIKADGYYD